MVVYKTVHNWVNYIYLKRNISRKKNCIYYVYRNKFIVIYMRS